MDATSPWISFALAAALAVVGACGVDAQSAPAASTDGVSPAPGGDASTPDAAACVAPPIDDSDDCTAPLAPGTDRRCHIQVGGKSRELLLYAPKSYDPCAKTALVVDAHGSNETDDDQAGLEPFLDWPKGLGSGWRLVADREGFVVAQPQGIGNVWSATDADFMLAIPGVVAKAADVDAARVFMTGISNGGALTYWTGCRDTPTFHGFASVSGYGVATCSVSHPAPLVHFHSADDKIISLADGKAAFQAWVKGNHCASTSQKSWQFGGAGTDPRAVCLASGPAESPPWSLAACDTSAPATTCETWSGCDGGTSATFCTVPADQVHHFDTTGGHVLYLNATHLSLAAVAWEYFRAPK